MSEDSPPPVAARLDLAAVRRHLEAQGGRQLWRSLDELARSPQFLEFLHAEFPRAAAAMLTAVDK